MKKINYEDIKDKINKENYISEGKQVKCYDFGDKVIKIFHDEIKSQLPMIKIEGLEKISNLQLKHFNKPLDFIYDDNKLIGYTEKKLEINDFDINIDINYFINVLDEIKEDVIVLSNNGFQIEDLFYNYSFSKGNLVFFDLISYKYINVKNDYLKDFILKKNIYIINVFLCGLIYFSAFTKGMKSEYTKIYKANMYVREHIKEKFFSDYFKENIYKFNKLSR